MNGRNGLLLIQKVGPVVLFLLFLVLDHFLVLVLPQIQELNTGAFVLFQLIENIAAELFPVLEASRLLKGFRLGCFLDDHERHNVVLLVGIFAWQLDAVLVLEFSQILLREGSLEKNDDMSPLETVDIQRYSSVSTGQSHLA